MGIDPEKLFVLFVIALVVLGPERLPKMARSLGRGLAELRKYTSSVQKEVDSVLAEPKSLVRSALEEAGVTSLAGSLRYIDAPYRPTAPPSAPALASGEGGAAGGAADTGPSGTAVAQGGQGELGERAWPATASPDALGPLPDDPSLN